MIADKYLYSRWVLERNKFELGGEREFFKVQ